jgi:hypothetical protein
MAHFAEINSNNEVIRVVVVRNEDILDSNGQESEAIGIAFCHQLFGGNWLQTSYNAKFRNNYADIGGTYSKDLDAFISPKPYPSWILDENTCKYIAPVPRPNGLYKWNENSQQWEAINF